MLAVFAEFEHATIVNRVTPGSNAASEKGRWMSGRTPYGYTRDEGLLVPDPVKAPIVRRIFRLYAEGKLGTTAIARALEAEGAPAPRKYGWSPNALRLLPRDRLQAAVLAQLAEILANERPELAKELLRVLIKGDPRAQPPPNRPDLSGSNGGSRNTF